MTSASTALAADVWDQAEFRGQAGFVEIQRVDPAEKNRITVAPSGAVPTPTGDPMFGVLPTALVVTDDATPLGNVSGNCERLSAHSARCNWPGGIDFVDAFLGAGNDSFQSQSGASGAATPIGYSIDTGDGNDSVSIPVSKGASVFTQGGNDTISVSQESYFEGIDVYAGGGNDRVTVTNAGGGQVDCGDGNDTAVIVGDRTGSTNCEGPA